MKQTENTNTETQPYQTNTLENGQNQSAQQGSPYQQPFNTPPIQQRPKRRGCCSIILIVFGVLILIGFISNLLSGNKEPSTKTVRNQSSEITKSENTPKTTAVSKDKDTKNNINEQIKKDPSTLDLTAALEKYNSTEYAFVTLADLDRYVVNMTGQNIYTVITIDEIDKEKIQANVGDGFMFQSFYTTMDYSPYFDEGDLVAVLGTVGESQSFLKADWTDIDECMVFAYGDTVKKYLKDSTDDVMIPYLSVSEKVANAEGTNNIREEEFKMLCKSYSYEDILRNPDNYKKKYIVISGTVDQTIDGTLDLYTSVFIIDASGNKWGGNITYKEGQSRMLEGDYVTIYGILNGTRKVKTIIGKQVTLPYIDIEYVAY